jgi:hypothetical protein
MSLAVDILQYLFVSIGVASFLFKYGCKDDRCNPAFDGQLHCLSGIILCHKPFFSFVMHCAGGMILLSASQRTDKNRDTSLLMLSLMFISLSGVINFDVRDFRPIHFSSLACVMVFSVSFMWLQCAQTAATVYTSITAAFVILILFNLTYTHWLWPWMNVQAVAEIAWVVCLLLCIMSTCTADDAPASLFAYI